jgi:hypothetical protein
MHEFLAPMETSYRAVMSLTIDELGLVPDADEREMVRLVSLFYRAKAS